YPTSII
nr:Chain C, TIP-1 PDZ domain [synthetic construct]4NNM_D Chain D, TIP-1 PDZ domain [synthetic construct]